MEKDKQDHKLRQRGWYYSHINADPKNENIIYASNTGFYRSIDGGKTFDERFIRNMAIIMVFGLILTTLI